MTLQEVFLEKNQYPKPLPLADIFQQPGEIILEIGFGKGHFIRTYAMDHPEYNFIGIERFIKWTRHTEARVIKQEISNIRLLCGLAQEVLKDYFLDHSIAQIHVLFPDPWPKRKHRKHRILQKPYIELFYQKLKPGGQLHITTDHKAYFEDAMKEFAPCAGKLFQVIPKTDYPYKTNYQIKYEKEGRPIYYFQANTLKTDF
ncbi:MAG: tRNA (guanosine(46)-N7)-methyltransferase TrmB [Deltaproteobacteria bacterium]|nr:tRNA (guanosine(46)-N7)-methyltransferase TrmB [Deltaproteobacteria bacterium]